MDFNIRSEDERLYTDNPVITDVKALFLQELDVLFSTEKFDSLSYPEMDNKIEQLLWKTNMSTETVKNSITNAIKSSCYMHEYFEWSVSIELYKGSIRDIAVIDINISANMSEPATTLQFIFK